MNGVAAVTLRSGGGSVMGWIRARVRAVTGAGAVRVCRRCLVKPRRRGLAFCSPECHTAWRVADAETRGYQAD